MKTLTLKEFIEKMYEKNPFQALQTARYLIELEGIERNLNIVWGVELDIKVKPAKKIEGRWYGKGLIKAIEKNKPYEV